MQNSEISAQDTFPKLLEYQAQIRGNRPALRRKIYGVWQTWTWSQAAAEVRILACGLAAKGFKRGDKLAIVGDNRPRFFFAVTAAHCLGGIPVPAYPDASADELALILNNSEARFAIVQDQEQVDKLIAIQDRCPKFQETISIDIRGLHDYDRSHLHIYSEIEAAGGKYDAEHPNFFAEQVALGKSDDTAVILYTAGTTGISKGVMFSHRNMITVGRNSVEQKNLGPDSHTLAILPLASATPVLAYYVESLIAGFCVSCPESSETVMNDLREIGPRYFVAPPHVFDYIYDYVMVRMEDAGFIKRGLFKFFMQHSGPAQILGWILIYGPLKNTLGLSRVRTALVYGDYISESVFSFFRALNIPLRQSYGTTEGFSYVTIQPPGTVRSRSVGVPAKDTEIKLSDIGEVVFRGPGVFQAYYGDPKATAEIKSADGWVRTGDEGELNKDGELVVYGRLMHASKLKNGSRFVPKSIEIRLKAFTQIKEVVAIGSDKDFVVALININPPAVGKWADWRALIYSGYSELASLDEVYALIAGCVEEVNRELAKDGNKELQVKRFAILNKELTANDGELTRSRKLRREHIDQRYQQLIDAMYAGNKAFSLQVQAAGEEGSHSAAYANIKIYDATTV